MFMPRVTAPLAGLALAALPALAETTVGITPEMSEVTVPTDAGDVVISRNPDEANVIEGDWARTSRPCPNFCIQPMVAAEGVTTVGELEMLAFLQDPEVIVVDSRVAADRDTGMIPGAISIPYNEAADRLDALGCELDFDGFICEAPKKVALYCNGNFCGQSPTAIRRMIAAGFPAENIYYYRGGMSAWRMLGLTVTGGN